MSIDKLLNRYLPRAVPVPEHVALARAVQRPNGNGGRAVTWWVLVVGAGLPIALACAALGWLWPSVAVLLAILVAEAGCGRQRAADAAAMVGVDARWRMALWAVIAMFALVRANALRDALGWVLLVLVVQAVWTIRLALSLLVHRSQPPLAFQSGGGRQNDQTRRYAALYRRADALPPDLAVAQGVGLLGATVLSTWWPPAIVAAILVLVGGRDLLEVRALLRGSAARASELAAGLQASGHPAVAYLSGGVGQAKYLLNPWLGAFEAVPGGVLVLIREASHLREIDPTPLPVVYAPHSRHVELLTAGPVRVAFYMANGGRNVDLQRDPRLRHVFLGHGDSDKATSSTPIVRIYDEIWVAGPAARERYSAAGIGLADERFAIIGRPQVDGLIVGALHHARPVVLYAPTFEGYYEQSNYSSLQVMGPELVDRLLARGDVDVWFKPHPSTGLQQLGMAQARDRVSAALTAAGGGHVVVDDRLGTTLRECFDVADVLIADVSSVVNDFLYTERPVLVTNPRGLTHADFRNLFPSQRGCTVVDDADGLPEALHDALGPDRMRQQRLDAKRRVLGDLPDGPIAAFVANTQRLAGGKPASPGAQLS